MKNGIIAIYLLLVVGIVFLFIQLKTVERKDTASIEAGEILYKQMCTSCHGNTGLGEGVKDGTALNNQNFLNNVSNQDLYHYIKFGREGTLMPSYQHLSDKQINQLMTYIRNWQIEKINFKVPETISGNIENGKKVYGLYCLSCHGIDGSGKKKMGTMLSNYQYLQYTTDKQIWISTAYGREKTRMAASLKGLAGVRQLTENEISDVITYIRSLDKK